MVDENTELRKLESLAIAEQTTDAEFEKRLEEIFAEGVDYLGLADADDLYAEECDSYDDEDWDDYRTRIADLWNS